MLKIEGSQILSRDVAIATLEFVRLEGDTAVLHFRKFEEQGVSAQIDELRIKPRDIITVSIPVHFTMSSEKSGGD